MTERAQGSYFERGTRRQSGAHRHVRRDVEIHYRNAHAGFSQLANAAVNVSGKLFFRRTIDRELGSVIQIGREDDELCRSSARSDPRLLWNRGREYEAVVVIRVLPEQVHASGRCGDTVRRTAEYICEGLHLKSCIRSAATRVLWLPGARPSQKIPRR